MRNPSATAHRSGRTATKTLILVLLSNALALNPALAAATDQAKPPPARGPLRVHPTNPRYFTDDGQRAVYLIGSHTWDNLQDMGETDPPAAFDFNAYLDFLAKLDHNVIRLSYTEADHS